MRFSRWPSVLLGLVWLTGCATDHARVYSDAAELPTVSDPRLEHALVSTLATIQATNASVTTALPAAQQPKRPQKTVPVATTASVKSTRATRPAKPVEPRVTFDTTPVGKVEKVNVSGRFAVLRFPLGLMPAVDRQLSVSRGGLEVGKLKVTGPQLDDSIVADILSGECQTGDEVSEH